MNSLMVKGLGDSATLMSIVRFTGNHTYYKVFKLVNGDYKFIPYVGYIDKSDNSNFYIKEIIKDKKLSKRLRNDNSIIELRKTNIDPICSTSREHYMSKTLLKYFKKEVKNE